MTLLSRFLIVFLPASLLLSGQAHQPKQPSKTQPLEDTAAVTRGRSTFGGNCGFCHGADAAGSRAPDLVRSTVVNHDENGSLIAPLLHVGRVEKGMPAFPNLKDDQVSDIVAYLHHQAYAAMKSASVPGDYPLAKLLTGNADLGKAYFEGSGGCTGCHSPTGNLAGIAKKYSPVDLQQHMVYPSAKNTKTAVVTTRDGEHVEGQVTHDDEFTISLTGADGWSRSFLREDVKVEVSDKLGAHRDLMTRYTDADIHNLFAYLETMK